MRYKLIILLYISTFLQLQSYDRDEAIEKIGDIVQIVIPVSVYTTTLILGDTQGQYAFYKSFASTVVTTQVLKYTVKEERPDGSCNTSFPSGHTSAAFQGAAFIHFRYGIKYAILPYIGAVFVGYSRVVAKKHYTHDVVAGALIGSVFSWYFSEPYSITKDVELEPVVYNNVKNNQNLYGIKITF